MAWYEYEIPSGSWGTEQKEITLALMAGKGFDGFIEGDEHMHAYLDEDRHTGLLKEQLSEELAALGIVFDCQYRKVEDRNWNEVWEKGFLAVTLDKSLRIRAPFHSAAEDLPLTIVIEPKMAFGTGHHGTTRLMLREMMKHPLVDKSVLDIGCGTGILGIYACLSGAARVLGIDTDRYACENALENMERNRITGMEVRQGSVAEAGRERFDLVLANLDRNTLLREMAAFAAILVNQGIFILSGILAKDAQKIRDLAPACHLSEVNAREDSNWVSLSFVKLPESDMSP